MTRKEIKRIAEVLRFDAVHCTNEHGVDCIVFDAFVRDLCRALKIGHASFRADKFTEACINQHDARHREKSS